jgi:phosphoglycerate dehydrogenase-like enzyme
MLILVSIYSPVAVWNIPADYVRRFRREFPGHTFLHAANDIETRQLIPEADVIFSSEIDRQQFALASRLKWIHSPAAGVGGMLFPEMVASPVVITNSRGVSAATMAEHTLAVTLALFRHLPLAAARQREHVWAQDEISTRGNRMIAGAQVLVVGLGAIGAAIATRMAALGARVRGIRRRAGGPAVEGVSAVATTDQLSSMLSEADVVVVSAPHTSETQKMIGRAELAAMKPGAVLVNVSRGRLVDEAALASALEEGRLAGAALDVFEHEPLAEDSRLWDLPNVLITPHTSGFRPDHWDVMTDLFAENLRRYDAGQQLLNVVDKRAGY